jgi:hypothetical protein
MLIHVRKTLDSRGESHRDLCTEARLHGYRSKAALEQNQFGLRSSGSFQLVLIQDCIDRHLSSWWTFLPITWRGRYREQDVELAQP